MPARNVLSICAAAAMLAGCGPSQPPLSSSAAGFAPQLAPERHEYRVLHRFAGGLGDGSSPNAGLIDVKGTLYGTTVVGGGSSCNAYGCGSVYSITPSGTETVLHRFAGSGDGTQPYAGLVNVRGTIYGTTRNGGANCLASGCGTVFSVTLSVREAVLHSFGGSGDGRYSYAGLISAKGALYGTTDSGGTHGVGTFFAITRSGTETVLYNFKGRLKGDGALPYAGLLNVNGTLYGTTAFGGIEDDGTVFAITTSGKERVLHSFRGGGDGAGPYAGLLNVNGRLYGTTANGGGNGCFSGYGCGTVFSILP